MKKVHVKDGLVDVIEMNVEEAASNAHPFIVDDSIEVYGGYTSNGDGTFTAPPPPDVTSAQVSAERDRRNNLAVTVSLTTGKSFPVDMDGGGRANIGDMALMAVIKNSSGITTNFTFRDANNVSQDLTNNEVIEMGMQAAASYDAIYKKSWALKALNPIPQDYTNDTYWT